MSDSAKRLTVATTTPYDVVVGSGVRSELTGLIPNDSSRAAVVYAPPLRALAEEIAVELGASIKVVLIEAPEAENAKTIRFVEQVWSVLGQHQFTRSDLVIGVGGGATTDVAGFIAASWLRGVRFVTIPTTVLGMVDAAVGGKTGINTAAGKNLVGAFHEPIGVLCDLDALRTLPIAESRSGMAEIIKCGFIADPSILTTVERDPQSTLDAESDVIADLIIQGIAVKAATVATDLKETGADGTIGREALNYGHTLGHAIERQEKYTMRHGEAIAIGMVFVAELAAKEGLIGADLVARHREVLASVGLPISYHPGVFDELVASMRLDKKTRGDVLRFVVLSELAKPVILSGPGENALAASYQAISAS